ncbi:MAG TPA: hypothetical protein VMT35_06695 [Ignavibacteriaceae bacterium]|nr:hypothetical protein [Ignavibacteriaceae bacterium]
MKKNYLFFGIILIFLFMGIKSETFAQKSPVMYFCEKWGNSGEVGIGDRFHKGYLTVVVKCDHALHLKDVHIQFDKWNANTEAFDYYKKFDYTLEPDMNYVYFSKNESSDMSFDESGIYRVFLLDDDNETITSALIEIID